MPSLTDGLSAIQLLHGILAPILKAAVAPALAPIIAPVSGLTGKSRLRASQRRRQVEVLTSPTL